MYDLISYSNGKQFLFFYDGVTSTGTARPTLGDCEHDLIEWVRILWQLEALSCPFSTSSAGVPSNRKR